MAEVIFALLLAILPDCEFEDSANCHWNAETMGNGYGDSFVRLGAYQITKEG